MTDESLVVVVGAQSIYAHKFPSAQPYVDLTVAVARPSIVQPKALGPVLYTVCTRPCTLQQVALPFVLNILQSFQGYLLFPTYLLLKGLVHRIYERPPRCV